MISRLLDDQHIRRRAHPAERPAGGGRRGVLARQRRSQGPRRAVWTREPDARLADGSPSRRTGGPAAAVRLSLLVFAAAVFVAGLMMVGADGSDGIGVGLPSVFAREVVSGDLARAAATVPAIRDAAGREIGFERTEDVEYVVSDGETLSEIAREFGLSYDELARYNRLQDPDTLLPGQRLIIPRDTELGAAGTMTR